MNTGENIQGLRKIMDFTRLVSIAILIIHFYLVCYGGVKALQLNTPIVDNILFNFSKLELFHTFLAAKGAVLLLLFVSQIAVRGRKDQKIRLRTALTYIAIGMLLYWISGIAFYTTFNEFIKAGLYTGVTSVGYLLLFSGSTLLTRLIRLNLDKDVFNKLNETFPQEERRLENEYSINLPTQYNLKGKIRRSWINIINPFRGLLVAGNPGSGKSYFVIRHVITQHIKKGFSMLVYDFKFDDLSIIAYNALLKYADEYKIRPKFYVIDLDKVKHRCNPLDPATMKDLTDASESSRTIMLGLNREWIRKQGDFFVESPINFLTAIIWFLRKYQDGRYCTLPHAIELMLVKYDDLFKVLQTEPEVQVLVNPFLSAHENEANEQLEGQIGSAKISIARLATPTLYYVLSGNDFTLDINNADEPKILCIGNNPQKTQVYGAVLSLYVNRLLKLISKKDRLKSSLVFDEFPTIYLSNISEQLGYFRGYKIATTLGLQDLSQLRKDYGKEQADVIVNVIGNTISGQVTGETAKALSERIGKIIQHKQSISINSSDTSVSHSTQLDAAVPPSTVSSLSSGEFVGIVSDDPDNKIELKAFHAEIINDHLAISQEEKTYEKIPEFRSVTKEMIQMKYNNIRRDVVLLVEDVLQELQAQHQVPEKSLEELVSDAEDPKIKRHLLRLMGKIMETEGLTMKDVLFSFRLEKNQAMKDLKLLKQAGLLKFIGATKSGRYKITDVGMVLLERSKNYF